MNQAAWGAVLVAVSAAAYWRNRFPTLRSVAVFLGIIMIGFSGTLVHLAARVMAFVGGFAGATIGHWLGLTTAVLVACIVAVLLFLVLHDWAPKNTARKSTYWFSVALAVLIVAGLTPFANLNNLPTTVQQAQVSFQGG